MKQTPPLSEAERILQAAWRELWTPRLPVEDAYETLAHGLLLVLEKPSGMAARAGALALFLGLFDSEQAAAEAAGVNRSNISRAMKKLRTDLARSLNPRAHRKSQ